MREGGFLSIADLCPRGLCPGGSLSSGDLCPVGVSVQGSLCPGRSLSREVSVQGGLCPGVSVQGVRILLECILVFYSYSPRANAILKRNLS